MLAILNSLNAHNFPIFQPILMILVSKFMVHRALFNKTYLLLGLLSPLILFLLNLKYWTGHTHEPRHRKMCLRGKFGHFEIL